MTPDAPSVDARIRAAIAQSRKLGTQGLEASALGLGCVGMSWMYGERNDAESIATIHLALDLGVTLFDTAEVYGPFENERLLGRALRGRRHQAQIATKFGFNIAADGRIAGLDSRPEHIRGAVEGSLQRLGTDHLDLLYQHQPDPRVAIEDVVGAMGELVSAGKVRYLGLSNAAPDLIRRAHAVHPISVVESEYSLWERGVEAQVLPTVRALGIGFVPYSPLGRGFITGTALRAEEYPESDYRRRHPRFQAGNFEHNMKIVEGLRTIAARKGVTVAQLALAWLLGQGSDIVPIPGTKRRPYLVENLAAADLRLTPAEFEAIEAVAPPGAAAGSRWRPGEEAFFDDF